MERFCLGIFAAVIVAIFLPILPIASLMLLLPVLAICCFKWRYFGCVGFLLFLSSLNFQVWQHQQAVKAMLARDHAPVVGTVVSIAQQYGDSYFFLFRIDSAQQTLLNHTQSTLVAVRWFEASARPLAGQRWRFALKLKAVRGVANPGSGNKEAAALVHGIVAQGTVQQALLLDDQRDWRQQAYDLLKEATGELQSHPLILALTVGERPFTPELWLALQSSGLSHLISISGMHIALVFGWILLLKPALQYLAMPQIWRERLLWSVALIAAFAYCILAGFAIPTWRALLAIVMMVLLKMLLRRTSGWRFSLVFTAVLLLCWPTLMLSLSFWLSVSAVALLFFMEWRFVTPVNWRAKIRQFVRFQWLFTLMLLPVSLLFFHGIAPLGFLCNLMFVPWISLVGIPALLVVFLLQLVWPSPLERCWQLVDWLFRPLIWLFEQLAVADYWWSLPELTHGALLCMMLGVCIVLLSRSKFAVPAALLFLLPSLWQWHQVKANSLHLVDVGQGTALILQQGDRALVYDVGPRYGDYSATKSHLLPYLRFLGIKHLDYLLLSHNDSDHTGHWQLLRAAYPDLTLVTDIRVDGSKLSCRELPAKWGDFGLQVLWSQHQVAPTNFVLQRPAQQSQRLSQQLQLGLSTTHFKSLLWPFALPMQISELSQNPQPKNHDSCVVLVKSHGTQTPWQFLLTGDADVAAERQIMRQRPELRADVLLLGHHGSKTSSDLAFLQQLQPKIAVNSAGYDNPYRHPALQVKARLDILQIPLYNTAEVGAIRIELADEKLILGFWRQQPWLGWLENVTDNAESPDLTR